MNFNTHAQPNNTCSSPKVVSKKAGAGNAEGTSITSMPGTSTAGLSIDSNQSGASGYTPPKLDKRTISSTFSDNETKANISWREDLSKANEPEQDRFEVQKFEPKINNAKDMAFRDYIPLPDVETHEKLMLDASFKNIKSQFLDDIRKLKTLVHLFVNNQYGNNIAIFYKNIKEDDESFHEFFFQLYKDTRFHLRCLVATLESCQGDETQKDEIAFMLYNCLEGKNLCPADIHIRFMDFHMNINTPKELHGTFLRIRTELFRQNITSFIAEHQRRNRITISGEMKIHLFTFLNNLLCESFNVPTIDDRYISNKMVKKFTDDFTLYIHLVFSSSAILYKLLNELSNNIDSILDQNGASEWKTKDMISSDINPDIINMLDSQIFKPINSYMGKVGDDVLTIHDLIDVKDNKKYSLKRYPEKLFSWFIINFLMLRDNDKSKPKVTVFTALPALPGTTNPRLYIGTVNGLFFWVFNDQQCLKNGQACDFDTNNHITLELSHLTSIDFSRMSEKLIYALLAQAMKQTNTAEEFASFLLNPRINKQLGKKTHWLMLTLSNQLTDLLAHKDNAFKEELCDFMVSKVDRANKKSFSKEAFFWLTDSLLLEPVLFKIQELKINITPITQSLTVDDIHSFSQEGITQLLTPEHCCRLFKQASTLNRRTVVLNLLLTENCDKLVYLLNRGNEPPLFFFVRHGIFHGVEYLLERGLVDVNKKNVTGMTALMLAAEGGHTDCLNALLNAKARINESNHNDLTALHYAAKGGHVECVRALVNKKNILFTLTNETSHTPLHYAAFEGHTECLNLLLEWRGTPVNAQNAYGITPLHFSVIKGHIEIFKTLLTVNGINVNVPNRSGITPLHLSSKHGRLEFIKVLLNVEGIEANVTDNAGETPLHWAAYKGHPECLHMLLTWGRGDVQINVQTKMGDTPLHSAALKGNTECFNWLLVHGANLNLKNKNGDTPFHLAAEKGHTEIIKALLRIKDIQTDMRNNAGDTPFQLALNMKRIDCLNLLRDVPGIQIDERDLLAMQRFTDLPQEVTPNFLVRRINSVSRRLLCHQNRP